MFLKKGDDRLQPGQFDQPIFVYLVAQTQDAAGGEIRTPRFEDAGNSPSYSAIANIQWEMATTTVDGERVITQQMAVVSIMYAPSRVPPVGSLVKIKRTGQVLEVRYVDPVNESRKKVELTCRLIV